MALLTLVRGLPGSGKSTTAKALLRGMRSGIDKHFEADMFFMKNGVYEFDGMRIGEAHEWCQQSTRECLEDDIDVIVSNTLTTIKELRPYIWMAKDTGSQLQVINCLGNFGNIHSVPEQVLINMRQRFVHDISSLLIEYGFLSPITKEIK